jgi:hypothetical protein
MTIFTVYKYEIIETACNIKELYDKEFNFNIVYESNSCHFR